MTSAMPRAVRAWLDGEPAIDLGRSSAPSGRPNPKCFKLLDKVWVAMPCPVKNALTGESFIWVEATVIGEEVSGQVFIVTERFNAKVTVMREHLRHRLPGEIQPGRKEFRP